MMLSTRSLSHPWPRLASIEAFAAILVPSIATVPKFANPARPAMIRICVNSVVNAS